MKQKYVLSIKEIIEEPITPIDTRESFMEIASFRFNSDNIQGLIEVISSFAIKKGKKG
jgi:hypothetical protein